MIHKPAPRIISLVGQDSTPFEEIFAVQDTAVVSKGIRVMDKLHPTVNPDTGEFYLTQAVAIVKSDPSLVILQLTEKNITQNNVSVGDIIDTLLVDVDNLIGVALSEATQEELHKTITRIFINLQPQENDPWVHIVSSKGATTYRYNMAFVVQNELTGWLFYVLPLALTVKINVDEKALFSLQLKDKVDCTVKIESLKIGAQITEPISRRQERLS